MFILKALIKYIVWPVLLLEFFIAFITFIMMKRGKDLRREAYYAFFHAVSEKYTDGIKMLTGLKEGAGLYFTSTVVTGVLLIVLWKVTR